MKYDTEDMTKQPEKIVLKRSDDYQGLPDKTRKEFLKKWSEMTDAEFEKNLTEVLMNGSKKAIDKHIQKTSKIPKIIEDFFEKQYEQEIRNGIKISFDTENHIANVEIDHKLAQKIKDGEI